MNNQPPNRWKGVWVLIVFVLVVIVIPVVTLPFWVR